MVTSEGQEMAGSAERIISGEEQAKLQRAFCLAEDHIGAKAWGGYQREFDEQRRERALQIIAQPKSVSS